jgi:DNA-binding response OmpR family regulator
MSIDKTILLIESDDGMRGRLSDLFAAAGLLDKVAMVHRLDEAADHLLRERAIPGRAPWLPCFAVVDAWMPDACLRTVRMLKSDRRTGRVPVVVLLRLTPQTFAADFYEAGANSCVRVAANDRDTVATIASMAEYWLVLNVFYRHMDPNPQPSA